jgi:hypothetical protein
MSDDPGQTFLPILTRVEHDAPRLGLVAEQEFDLEAAPRQQRAETLGPFD